jgi:hypothetical protein
MKRNRKIRHTPHPYVIPPKAIAIVTELLGACPECGAPLERTWEGFCLIEHLVGCELAETTRSST